MKTSSLSLSAGSLLLISLLSPAVASEYQLVESWQGEEFFDYFHFYTGADPTNGWVTYLDQASAESSGLVKVTDQGSVYIGVDHKTTLSTSGKGRDSVRVGTTKYYEHSLVVADIAHMPGNVCGSWPAFWTVGKEWPQDGEIDIIEGVNLQDHNEIVMHTAGTCALTDTGMSGIVNETGCGEALGTVGCVIEGHKGSYGTSFNNNGGGVYAMEWTEEFLKIWFFPRKSIPASITKGEPDVSEFGIPMALVQDGCDVANSFKEQSFVFDVTFCGDWAGGVFGDSGCPMTSSDSFQSCTNYVAQNPAKFKETYWEINSVKVYQTGVNSTVSAPSHISATHGVSQAAVTHHQAAKTATKARIAQASHASDSVASHATEAIHSVESATHAADIVLTVDTVAPMVASTSAAVASQAAPDASEEQASASTHAKPAVTRYVTKYVTGTTTVCTSTESSTPDATAKIVVPSSLASHVPQPAETTHSASSFEIEPAGAGWKTSTEGAAEPHATPSAHTTSAPHSTPSGTPQRQDPPAKTPHCADAASINPSSPRPPPSQTTPTASHQKPTAGPSGDSGAVKPLGTPQSSKPVIPKPSGDSPASTSGFHVFPGASNSASSPVFTGAADRLSVKYSMIAAAFGLALVA
ncbi:hypothetical protein N7486_009947 [Penicillium sp. IBT 16267x]|nr:hypothetical protein N7486_009947 [Penicillium sp. IBT 16267x]